MPQSDRQLAKIVNMPGVADRPGELDEPLVAEARQQRLRRRVVDPVLLQQVAR